MKKITLKLLCLVLLALLSLPFQAMAQDDVDPSDLTSGAVILTRASDYSVYSHAVATVAAAGEARALVAQDIDPSADDTDLAAFGEYFYRLGRMGANYVTKYALQAPDVPLWQFSVAAAGDDPNPHDMVFASASRAFLLFYNIAKAWIVDPSVDADSEASFKIGELDLSAYSDSDGVPEMTSGIVVDGKLFVILQRLNQTTWDTSNPAYVAVFDAATGEEIDTGMGGAEGLNGICLDALEDADGNAMNYRNPEVIHYLSETGLIYLQAAGPVFPAYSSYGYTYGVLTINPSTYEVNVVIPAGTAASHDYSSLFGMAVVSADKGYFIDYTGYDYATGGGVCNLYSFNPTTGAVADEPIADLSGRDFLGIGDAVQQRMTNSEEDILPYFTGKDLGGYRIGMGVDENDFVWVADASANQIAVLDPDTDTVDQTIDLNLKPTGFVFPKTSSIIFITGGSSSSDDQGCFIRSMTP